MKVIGLTGGIASGKSTISKYLKKLGAFIIDVDKVAKDVVEPGEKAWALIKEHFGRGIIKDDQSIDRKKLAKIVFSCEEERKNLNSIVHPEVIKKTEDLIQSLKKDDKYALIVVDAPLLIEAGMVSLVEEVWLVVLNEEEQIKRIVERDKISREEALKRIISQMKTEEKLKYATKTIDNNGTIEDTLKQVKDLYEYITGKKNDYIN